MCSLLDRLNPPPQESEEPDVILYTDGACKGNPGPGGWAYILEHPATGKTLEASGAEFDTTNNRMELQAAIEGLRRLRRPVRVRLVTDSAYVELGITRWIHSWKRNGWRRKTASGWEPVKNEDLWKELLTLFSRHEVRLQRVRGHAGHPENERCDELAVKAYKKLIKNQQA